MSFQHAVRNALMQASLAVVCVATLCPIVGAQSEQPPTHADMYARIKQNAVIKKELRSTTGDALTPEQLTDLDKATAALEKAESLLKEAKYAEAAAAAVDATRIRAAVLGNQHYLTISSVAIADVAARASKMPPEDQAKFAAADKALSDWDSLNKDGRYEAAREKAAFALDYAKQNLPESHPLTALAYLRLGTTQIDLGEYNAALTNLEKAVSLTKAIFGASHPQYAEAMDRLGWVNIYLAGQGADSKARVDAAVDSLQTAVQVYRSTVGETEDTAESLDNLGTAFAYAQHITEALDSKLRALFIRETLLGPDARDTGVSLSNLAWLYGRVGLTAEVLPMRERALEIFKKLLRPDHPYIYLESANVGWDYHLAGRDDEAIRLFESLVEQDKTRENKLRPDVVQRLARLAEVNAAASRFSPARTIMEQAFDAIKKLYAAGYTEQAIGTLASMARAANRARMLDLSDRYFSLVCEWAADPKNGVSATERSIYEKMLGSTLLELGKFKEAKQVLTDCVKRLEADKPENRLQLIEPLIYLSRIETELGDFDAATKHADRAVQIAESRSANRDFSTAFPQLWLGRAFARAGNVAMAQFCLNEAMTTFDRLVDRDPTGAMLVRIELASTLANDSKQAEAIKLLKDALAKCDELKATVNSPYLDAMRARVLRSLCENSAGGATTREERDTWKQEAIRILKSLESNQLLNAEEKAWLAENAS
ncbi:MAG: tetratricopeptide repeat protein [Phycisphaerales bacterium]|nr:tetratricopeptide repeat protein [Phycisphaerales bacterium]